MAVKTNWTYDVTCDWCGRTVAENSKTRDVPGMTVFRLGNGSPGATSKSEGVVRNVEICKPCCSANSVADFILWLQTTDRNHGN